LVPDEDDVGTLPPRYFVGGLSDASTLIPATIFRGSARLELAEYRWFGVTIMIPGYEILSEIYRGGKRVVYRCLRSGERTPVIIKSVVGDFPSDRDLASLKRECEVLQNLQIEGVVKTHGLVRFRNCLALILEDVPGDTLRVLIDSGQIDLAIFFNVGILLSQIIGDLHQHRVIHKDINPRNVIFDLTSGRVTLIDFSLASGISRDQQAGHPSTLQGTLAYIAPEQTGRMNRAIDYRVDLYSLGITFYELLTGQLPFRFQDPMELIHAHIAKSPIPPHELSSHIPQALSAILLRLLAKNPEDRYKSARGLKIDLEICAAQWQATGAIEGFTPGQSDFSEHFQISQKLYGREEEIKVLIEAFVRVSSGATELMLISGYSGIGKSALVNEVHKPIARKGGYFISGKFDQFARNIPYSAVIQAFQELVRQVLTESDDKIRAWKERLTSALGSGGQVIIEVIPEVEMIIGRQSPLPVLPAAENQHRFNRVFQNFASAFSDQNHPLVIFLDDLQWADIPSLNLVRLITTNLEGHHLFVIGAYRDNEVDDAHPLMSILADIRKQRAITDILLKPLAFTHLEDLIADTLNCAGNEPTALATLVHQKTDGNPFFVNMFLKSLHQDSLISFDPTQRKWTFDLEKIASLDIAENVIELMVRRIRKLPVGTQSLLSLAACIGNQFDLKTLSVICELPLAETLATLELSIVQGLVLPVGDDPGTLGKMAARFRFLHDRVQQAAYSLVSVAERPGLHVRIGSLLLNTLSKNEFEERKFEVIDHLNAGASQIADPQQRTRLAELNLEAATKAKLSSAYEPALRYANAGIDYLPENPWGQSYELTHLLFLEKGELEYLTARWDAAIATFDYVLFRSSGVMDRCKVNQYKVTLHRAKNELRTSLNIALEALEELGFKLVEPDEAQLRDEVTKFYALVNQDVDVLFNIPELVDAQKLLALILLREAMNGAFFVGSKLLFTISMKMVEITIKDGNSPHASVAYMYQAAFTLAGLVCDFENAHRLGKLALRLNEERYHVKPYEAIILNNWGGFISHHTEDVHTARAYLDKGYYIALENGMYQWTGYCAINRLYISFWGPDTLDELVERIDRTLPWLRRFDQNMAQYFCAIKATTFNLRQAVDNWRILPDSVWPNADKVVKGFEQRDDLIGQLVNATCRLSLANWYLDYQEAIHYAAIAEKWVAAGLGMYLISAFHFH
jgi:predicted ATPase